MTTIQFPGKLGFGGAPLGNLFNAIDELTAEATVQAAWETGIRHFDTAPIYGRGLSEHRLGNVLRGHSREDYILSTKVGRLTKPRRDAFKDNRLSNSSSAKEAALFIESLSFDINVDYGYDAAIRSIEDSLQRLGLSYIDIVYVHDLGPDHLGKAWEKEFDLAINGSFQALSELRSQGIIKAWGLGNNVVAPLIRALQETDADILQLSGRYTLLDQTALQNFLPMCLARKTQVVLGGNFNSGILAGSAYYNYHLAMPELLEKRDRILGICKSHGVDIRAASLQFGAAHPAVGAIIPGSKDPLKVRQNTEFFRSPIPEDFWAELKSSGIVSVDAPTP